VDVVESGVDGEGAPPTVTRGTGFPTDVGALAGADSFTVSTVSIAAPPTALTTGASAVDVLVARTGLATVGRLIFVVVGTFARGFRVVVVALALFFFTDAASCTPAAGLEAGHEVSDIPATDFPAVDAVLIGLRGDP
jgi:hypothetical protein